MANIVSITEVNDFDSWKEGFERYESLRNQNGVFNPRIFRFESNRNKFVIMLDVTDVEQALRFLKSSEPQEAMKRIGVVSIEFAVPSSTITA